MPIEKLAPSRPLDNGDAEVEVVPASVLPAGAETNTTTEPDKTFLQQVLDDHAVYRAVHDCHWFDQLAFRAGASVSASHPGVALWLVDGVIERVDKQDPTA
jgi:hypothetical protein